MYAMTHKHTHNIAPRLVKISWANEIGNLQGVFYRQDAEDFSLNVNDNAIAINARFEHPRENPSAPNPRIGPVKHTMTAKTKPNPARAISTFMKLAIMRLLSFIEIRQILSKLRSNCAPVNVLERLATIDSSLDKEAYIKS